MYEVERKYRIRKKDYGRIAEALFDRWFAAIPSKQRDTYLRTKERNLTTRVRTERTPEGFVYLLTDKRKSNIGKNTNSENEIEIQPERYDELVEKRLLRAYKSDLVVRKKRIHYDGIHKGHKVTVCVDHAKGPHGIDLGRFVEFEMMVEAAEDIPLAHDVLKDLAKKVLPKSRKRELRGYRKLLIHALQERHQGGSASDKKAA